MTLVDASRGNVVLGEGQCCFRIGGVSLGFGCDRATLGIHRTLAMFNVMETTPDISISVGWVRRLRLAEQSSFDAGSTWKVRDLGSHLQFDFCAGSSEERPYKRLVTDKQFCVAKLQMSEEVGQSFGFLSPLSYPLDELLIMHRLTQEKAIELHGTGIVRSNGEANLFVGHSGAGKSTTTRLWTAMEDVEVLSDDRIIVRRDEAAPVVEAPCAAGGAASKPGVLRLRDRSASPNGHFAQDDKNKRIRMYGTPWHGDAMYASPNSALLSRIFVLEHGFGNVITPLTASQAVAELFARSFVPFHRHEYVDSALDFLQELVDSVPVYRYSFEPDQGAVEKILHFHD